LIQAVNLRANQFTHFPHQLKVARHTAREIHLVSCQRWPVCLLRTR
jgi:hypothetical protein